MEVQRPLGRCEGIVPTTTGQPEIGMERGNYGSAPLGLILAILVVGAAAAASPWAGLAALIVVVLVVLAVVVDYKNKPKCPNCGARRLDYLHLRQDGGPDLRYAHNPLVCYSCGQVQE